MTRKTSEKIAAHMAKMHAANVTHGASKTRAYGVWLGMKSRCENPNRPHYERYGGRGIGYCKRWMDFSNFLADMGQPPQKFTIERIDNDGPYSPENCRWASRAEQMSNRSICRNYTVGNKTMNISQWAKEIGIHRNTLDKRLNSGMPIEQAISERARTHDEIVARSAELQRAKTHCKWGHEWTPENTGRQRNNGRLCRTCHRIRQRERQQAKRGV